MVLHNWPFSTFPREAPMDVVTDAPRVQRNSQLPAYSNDDKLLSEINCVTQYEMTEPLGFAVLTGNSCQPDGVVSQFAKIDLELMERTLDRSDWGIYTPCSLYDDIMFDHSVFETTIDHLSRNEGLGNYSCFLFYYTGHGVDREIVAGNGERIPYWDVVHRLSELPALCDTNKPKIFIFDTCRGIEKVDPNFEIKDGSRCMQVLYWYDESKQGYDESKIADTIVCFAACLGGESIALEANRSGYRSGSIYTMQLAHAIQRHRATLSFSQIVTIAQRGTVLVSRALDRCHQPEYRSSLTQLLYLTRTGKCY